MILELQKLLDAVKHNNNLENNVNLGFYWFRDQQYYKAKACADEAIKHKEGGDPEIINSLHYLMVNSTYAIAGDDIDILKTALPFIRAIEKHEGDKYINMSQGLSTLVEKKIAELESDGKDQFKGLLPDA